jgi:hypothetical protein
MTQPHGFPGGCIAYKPTILLLYSRSLCRNVNKYCGLMLLNPLFRIAIPVSFLEPSTAAILEKSARRL